MCSIAGIYRIGKESVKEEQIRALLLSLEHRGRDASGIALIKDDGEIFVTKDDSAAWRFVSSRAYEEAIEEQLDENIRIVLTHTRLATQGSPRNPVNNHPVSDETAAIVHNGMISNDDSLFRELTLKRCGDVDSDIIRGIVSKFGLTRVAVRNLEKMRGS